MDDHDEDCEEEGLVIGRDVVRVANAAAGENHGCGAVVDGGCGGDLADPVALFGTRSACPLLSTSRVGMIRTQPVNQAAKGPHPGGANTAAA